MFIAKCSYTWNITYERVRVEAKRGNQNCATYDTMSTSGWYVRMCVCVLVNISMRPDIECPCALLNSGEKKSLVNYTRFSTHAHTELVTETWWYLFSGGSTDCISLFMWRYVLTLRYNFNWHKTFFHSSFTIEWLGDCAVQKKLSFNSFGVHT